jgi:hypothetical protein
MNDSKPPKKKPVPTKPNLPSQPIQKSDNEDEMLTSSAISPDESRAHMSPDRFHAYANASPEELARRGIVVSPEARRSVAGRGGGVLIRDTDGNLRHVKSDRKVPVKKSKQPKK